MNSMVMIRGMHELMNEHGYRYSFAIQYNVQSNGLHVEINPACTHDCAYPITLIAANDRDLIPSRR